jgi:peptidoglycan/LPS O-acetylase OafA/YrhL
MSSAGSAPLDKPAPWLTRDRVIMAITLAALFVLIDVAARLGWVDDRFWLFFVGGSLLLELREFAHVLRMEKEERSRWLRTVAGQVAVVGGVIVVLILLFISPFSSSAIAGGLVLIALAVLVMIAGGDSSGARWSGGPGQRL